MPMYWSPSRPAVRILAEESTGNCTLSLIFMITRPWYVFLSSVIDVTWPTDTPALRTGAFFFRPPMLSKRARTV